MKKTVSIVLICLIIMAGVPKNYAWAEKSLELESKSVVLLEASSGEVLYEKNTTERRIPASVTKLMTLLLLFEAVDKGEASLSDTVTASAHAASMGGSQIWLKESEQMTVSDMLKAVCVVSANDCAVALAEQIAGSEDAFVERMNQRAKELGMNDTTFKNATGLPARGHVTSAYDIALMSRQLLKYHPLIKNYTTIWMDTVRDGQFGLSNTNKLVRFYDGTTGLKTGYTSAAGHCLSASAERNGMELIAVVLHCASSTDRFESAKALLNYGFSNYALVTPEPGELPAVPVTLGTSMEITPVLADETPILIDKALAAGVETRACVDESVTAPVEAGQTLGTLTITSGGQTIAERDLIAPEAVGALRWGDVYLQMLRALCMG